MRVILDNKENIELLYTGCPLCQKSFNSKRRKKTQHHILPKMLKPKIKIVVNLCEECHEKLNKKTIMEVKKQKFSPTFGEFKKNYNELRKNYYDKKINRGEFGEGLWSNLMSFLESKEKK